MFSILYICFCIALDPSDISVCLKDDLLYKKVSKNIPWVDLSVSENVVAWAVARQVLRVCFEVHVTMETRP